MRSPRDVIESRLASASSGAVAVYAATTSFIAYFCIYAFRRPFTVGLWEGERFLDTDVTLKTAYVLAQLFGYVVSKYVGVRICPALPPARRFRFLAKLMFGSLSGLALLATLGGALGTLGLFVSALPLGMVWGILLAYLEGRRRSEAMMALLSCSFIVSSGVVKDVGRALLSWGVRETTMPMLTALLFALPFLASCWALDRIPPPTKDDLEARSPRLPMPPHAQRAFLVRYALGLALFVSVYVGLTALRDYRDNYAIDILTELGAMEGAAIFSRLELPAAIAVLGVLGALSWVEDNRRAFLAMSALVFTGVVTIGVSAAASMHGLLSPTAWLTLTGVGVYVAYVPFSSMLFERVMALTRSGGTLVLATQLFDALGYSGSALAALYKDLWAVERTRADFFATGSIAFSVLGAVAMALGTLYFARVEPEPLVTTPQSPS